MSLLVDLEAHLAQSIEDDVGGFARPITVTDPSGASAALVALVADIGQTIDPETGQLVSGRQASVAIRISSLTGAGLSMPRGISGHQSRPWRVSFADVNGTTREYRVTTSQPDVMAGVLRCSLEAYEP